jgi:hypothetical protein
MLKSPHPTRGLETTVPISLNVLERSDARVRLNVNPDQTLIFCMIYSDVHIFRRLRFLLFGVRSINAENIKMIDRPAYDHISLHDDFSIAGNFRGPVTV